MCIASTLIFQKPFTDAAPITRLDPVLRAGGPTRPAPPRVVWFILIQRRRVGPFTITPRRAQSPGPISTRDDPTRGREGPLPDRARGRGERPKGENCLKRAVINFAYGVEAAGIEPEQTDLLATPTTGQAKASSGQIESPTGQTRPDVPPTHVEQRTEPVEQAPTGGHPNAPIAPPRDLLYLAWAWPQLPEQMRAGIVSLVGGYLNVRTD